jgi:hypothetical protein
MALRPLASVFAVGRVQFAARTQEKVGVFAAPRSCFPTTKEVAILAKRRRLEGAQGDKKVYD